MPPLKPDPQALYDAGKKTVDTSGALGNALNSLLGALGASSGMCGDDPSGVEVAQAYNNAAKALTLALVDTVNGSARIGDGCQASAANYANANHASSLGPSTAMPLQFPTPTAPKTASLPPSAQGGQGTPGWLKAIESLIGMLCPNGDVGKMRGAAGSWRQMAEACHTASAALTGPKSTAAEQGIPEVEKMGTAFTTATTSLDTAATQCASVAEKLDTYAAHVQDVHDKIRDLASQLGDPAKLLESAWDWVTGKDKAAIQRIIDDIRTLVNNFKSEASSVAHLLAPLVAEAEAFGKRMLAYAEMAAQEVENLAYNAAAEVVNTAATWAYAAATHPGDVLLVAGGLALADIGAGGEVAGVALDATGIGAVVGIPANVASAAAIATGVTAAGAGLAEIGQAASKHDVTVMESRTGRPGEGIDRGDGRDPYGHWVNGNTKPGSVAEREGVENYGDRNPGRWISTEKKMAHVDGAENGRYYDGLAKKPDGTYEGIEVKSGNASLTPGQKAFDGAVSAENPAYVTIVNEQGQVETVKVTSVHVEQVPAE